MNVFKKPGFLNVFVLVMIALLGFVSSAFADLEGGMNNMQDIITRISNPLAIIFLIVAAWLKALGNDMLFLAALVGTIVMFAAPQIVAAIKAAFGG